MPQMPEMQRVTGKARYEGGTLHFDVASGSAAGLRTSGATIDLTGLDGPAPQYASLRLPIVGSAPDVIRFLARPKLGLSRDMLYDYRRGGGEAGVGRLPSLSLLGAPPRARLALKAPAPGPQLSLEKGRGGRHPPP